MYRLVKTYSDIKRLDSWPTGIHIKEIVTHKVNSFFLIWYSQHIYLPKRGLQRICAWTLLEVYVWF